MATSHEDKSSVNTLRTFRRWAIFARWLDIFFLTVVATTLCLLVRPALLPAANALGESLGQWHAGFRYFLSTMIAALTWWLLAEIRGFRLQHLINFRNFCCYPPAWFAALTGVLAYHLATHVLAITSGRIDAPDSEDYLSLLFGIVIASSLHYRRMLFQGQQQDRRSKTTPEQVNASDSTSSPSEIYDFASLEREAPITDPAADKFGLSPIARRIARMLQETPLQTIGLIGPYGCGKSSVLKMVEHYLRYADAIKYHPFNGPTTQATFPACRLILCRVDTWGFDDDATKQRILDVTISAMSDHVDVLEIASVPTQYQQLISSAGGSWGEALSSILGSKQSPEALLERIDRVLACINARVIVFLEDLDRNRNVGKHCKDVEAILDRIKDLHHISFVLSCGPEMVDAATLVRTCEHSEVIPSIDFAMARNHLMSFRKQCLARYSEDFQPVPKEQRDLSFGADRSDGFLRMLTGERSDPASTIAGVLRTPRSLKSALRWSFRKWCALHGECDLDDILVASAIHTASTDTYSLMLADMERFRKYPNWPEGTATEASDDNNDIKSLYARELKQDVLNTARKLPVFHAEIFRLTRFVASSLGTDTWKPQGLFVDFPTDYWARMNSGEIEPHELRDQEFFQVLNRAQDAFRSGSGSDTDELAVSLGTRPLWGKKLEQFSKLVSPAYLKHMVTSYFGLVRSGQSEWVYVDHSLDEQKPRAYFEIWRVAKDVRIEDFEDWILREYDLALDYSLEFAKEVLYYWGGWSRDSQARMESRETAQSIRRRSTEILKLRCEENPGELLRLLKSSPEEPYAMAQLLFACNSAFDDRVEWASWIWLASPALDAIDQEPEAALPPIALLVTSTQRDVRSYSMLPVFNQEAAQNLFAGQLPSLYAALSKEIDLSHLEEGVRRRVEVAQRYAREQLQKA